MRRATKNLLAAELARLSSRRIFRGAHNDPSFLLLGEAVGPQSERVPMLNLCWDGIYSNMVGTGEVVDLCKEAGAEPLLVVNMESDGRMHWAYPKEGMNRLGTADEAAEWVDYCNNPNNELRLSHGVREPYNVRFWQIGNETSYDQRGFDVETAAQKTLAFARKMKRADPSIRLLAWGDNGWAKRMCEVAGGEIDYIAFHYHFGDSGLPDCPLNDKDYRKDPDNTWKHLMNTCKSLESYIDTMREQVKPHGKRLAMTEGHYVLAGRDRCDVLSTWGQGSPMPAVSTFWSALRISWILQRLRTSSEPVGRSTRSCFARPTVGGLHICSRSGRSCDCSATISVRMHWTWSGKWIRWT